MGGEKEAVAGAWGFSLSPTPTPFPYARLQMMPGGVGLILAGPQSMLCCSPPPQVAFRALLAALKQSLVGKILIAA